MVERALEAHKRLAAHWRRPPTAATATPPSAAGRWSGCSAGEALEVDLGRLEERADAERDRLQAMLEEACGRLAPGRPTAEVVAGLLEDHPDAGGVLREAEAMTAERSPSPSSATWCPGWTAPAWSRPRPRRAAGLAMMSWAAPYEADAPSRYYISPPDPDWPAGEQDDWPEGVQPHHPARHHRPRGRLGHFAHGRRLRQAGTDVRRTLQSLAFVEGWAHYGEEVCVEEGFRADDPRFAAGVALEALQRVTRLAVSIGTHAGTMTVADGAARFEADAARSCRPRRGLPGHLRPHLRALHLGEAGDPPPQGPARARWGAGFSPAALHDRLLRLGAPPLGLMATALDQA